MTCDCFSTSPAQVARAKRVGFPSPEAGIGSIVVADLDATARRLAAQGTRFRGEIVGGPGGRQILIEDPAGNPVELFQPKG